MDIWQLDVVMEAQLRFDVSVLGAGSTVWYVTSVQVRAQTVVAAGGGRIEGRRRDAR